MGSATTIRSRYKGYCWTCHYTIWLNERIKFDGRAKHLDCLAALHDPTPRELDPRWVSALGKPKKGRVKLVTGAEPVRSTRRTRKAWKEPLPTVPAQRYRDRITPTDRSL